jgi:hypothetical protein
MIIAVEAKKDRWDFSCANDFELFKALEIDCDKLDVKFIDFSKLSFGAVSRDISTVRKALSKKGIPLRSGEPGEAGTNRDPSFPGSDDEPFFNVHLVCQPIVARRSIAQQTHKTDIANRMAVTIPGV